MNNSNGTLDLLKENATRMDNISKLLFNDFKSRQLSQANKSEKGYSPAYRMAVRDFNKQLEREIKNTIENIKIDNINIDQVDKLAETINTSCKQIQEPFRSSKKLLTIYQNIRHNINNKNMLPIFYNLHYEASRIIDEVKKQYPEMFSETIKENFFNTI